MHGFVAGYRHQSAVTQCEAQAVICDLLTAVEAVTTDGSFPRSKPLQTAFLARIFCEK